MTLQDEWEDVVPYDPADEWEDVPADEFEDVHPDEDVEIVSAPPKDQTSRMDAFASGLNTGVPGAAQLGAGMQSAVDVVGGRRASLLEAYRANRATQEKAKTAAQRDHPAYYMSGNIPAAMATAIASGAAIPAKMAAAAGPIATDFIATLAPTVAGAYSEGRGTPLEISKDMATGAAFGAGVHGALGGARKLAGAALEAPQKGLDAAADWLGGSHIGRWLGEGAEDAGTSARVKGLKADVGAAESFKPRDPGLAGDDLSSRLAKAAHEGRATLDDGFTADPKEFGDDFAKISRDALDEAVERFAHGRSSHRTPITAMEGDAKALRTPKKPPSFTKEMAKAELDANPSLRDEVWWKSKTADVPTQAKPDPVNSDAPGSLLREPGNRGQYGDADKPDWYRAFYKKNATGEEHGDDLVGLDRARERQGWDRDSRIGTSREQREPVYNDARAKELDDAVAAIKPRAKQNLTDELKYVVGGARSKLDRAKGIDADNATNAKYLGDKAAKAQDQIERIARGRETITKGATLGAAAAGGTKDLLTAGIGLAAGKQIGKSVLAGIDLAGEAGQRLAKTASLAEQWATRDDGLGRAARWALSAKGDAAIVRLMALAKLPEARDEQ